MTTNEELSDYWQGFSTRIQNDLNFVTARPRVDLAIGALERIEREVQRQRKLLEIQPTQPAPDGGEWRVEPEPLAPMLAAIKVSSTIIASCMTTETATQIVAEHNAVP